MAVSKIEQLSAPTVRRMALAAQGFAEARPTGRIDRRHLKRVLDRVGMIQIDSVNVLVRSQELPLFARLGPHPRTLIPDAAEVGQLFEYWGHAACHIPSEHHHLYRWKMARSADKIWRDVRELERRRPGFIDEIEDRIRSEGPLVTGDVSQRVGPKQGSWWDWDDGKLALEHLFVIGRVTARRRTSDFARIYDLTERHLPAEHLGRSTPSEADGRKGLLLQAATAMGVATARDLARYNVQVPTQVKGLIGELVEDGLLTPVKVEGWTEQAYMDPNATTPRRILAAAFLSPFDSVCWERAWLEQVFGFHYRIEIYVPKPKRIYGYYVLPFLMGDRFVGRADFKADRARSTLLISGAFSEADIDPSQRPAIAATMAGELRLMAGWLGLEHVEIGAGGDLAQHLRAAL